MYGFPKLKGKGSKADFAEIVRQRVFVWVLKAYDVQQDRIKRLPDERIILQGEMLTLKRFLKELRELKRCQNASWWYGKRFLDADKIYEDWLKEKSIRSEAKSTGLIEYLKESYVHHIGKVKRSKHGRSTHV